MIFSEIIVNCFIFAVVTFLPRDCKTKTLGEAKHNIIHSMKYKHGCKRKRLVSRTTGKIIAVGPTRRE